MTPRRVQGTPFSEVMASMKAAQDEHDRLVRIERAVRAWVGHQNAGTATPEHWDELCEALGMKEEPGS